MIADSGGMAQVSPTQRAGHMAAVALLMAVAVAARIVALPIDGAHHADESFQYLEQAYRLVFGYGIVPWEYRYGMRSWLLPLMLAGPMRLGAAIDPAGPLLILCARGFAALCALAPLWAAYAIGGRISRGHALVALAVVGLWYEQVYFSVHILTEVLAAAAFLPAVALLGTRENRRSTMLAGALLALTVLLRFQYAPAVGVFALVAIGCGWRRWVGVAIGVAAMLAIGAAIDMAMGGMPFGWLIENVRQNLLHARADAFGVSGPFAYLSQIFVSWGFAAPAILVFAAFGARRQPALAAAAIVNLALHMTIGHKEYRFIFLTLQIAVLLAAIGSFDFATRFAPRLPRTALIGIVIALWLAASAALAFTGRSRQEWRPNAAGFALARIAGDIPRLCGIALIDMEYWQSGGDAFLHRRVPIYFPIGSTQAEAERRITVSAPAWNAAIAPPFSVTRPASYHPVACRGYGAARLCLYVRPGGCRESRAAGTLRLQAILNRYDF